MIDNLPQTQEFWKIQIVFITRSDASNPKSKYPQYFITQIVSNNICYITLYQIWGGGVVMCGGGEKQLNAPNWHHVFGCYWFWRIVGRRGTGQHNLLVTAGCSGSLQRCALWMVCGLSHGRITFIRMKLMGPYLSPEMLLNWWYRGVFYEITCAVMCQIF